MRLWVDTARCEEEYFVANQLVLAQFSSVETRTHGAEQQCGTVVSDKGYGLRSPTAAAPVAAPPLVLTRPRAPTARRLSLQLYGALPASYGALRDFEQSTGPKCRRWREADFNDRRRPWLKPTKLTHEELREAEKLVGTLFLNRAQPPAWRGDAAWERGLRALNLQACTHARPSARPHGLASAAIASARPLATEQLALEATPYAEGKHDCGYPTQLVSALNARGVDVASRAVTGEAALGALHLAGLPIHCVPASAECDVTPLHAEHTAYQPIHVRDTTPAMRACQDELVAFLDTMTVGSDGIAYSAHDRLRFAVDDGTNASSIYFGVCGGNKCQKPVSNRIGMYDTHEHARFSTESQIALKRALMLIVQRYVRLAEEQVRIHMPAVYAQQARMRELLNRHPCYQLHTAADGVDAHYRGCGLSSVLFEDGYISLGGPVRSRHVHTDYRNPSITHLSTRLIGDWGDDVITGQTVLLDRYSTCALVIADSPAGRQLIGGLNGIKHANLGPDCV